MPEASATVSFAAPDRASVHRSTTSASVAGQMAETALLALWAGNVWADFGQDNAALIASAAVGGLFEEPADVEKVMHAPALAGVRVDSHVEEAVVSFDGRFVFADVPFPDFFLRFEQGDWQLKVRWRWRARHHAGQYFGASVWLLLQRLLQDNSHDEQQRQRLLETCWRLAAVHQRYLRLPMEWTGASLAAATRVWDPRAD